MGRSRPTAQCKGENMNSRKAKEMALAGIKKLTDKKDGTWDAPFAD